MEDNHIPVPVVHVIAHPRLFEGVEVHVKISGKLVKLNYSGESFMQIIEKLQSKGVELIYVNETDFCHILELFQNNLTTKRFYDPKTTDEERVATVEATVTSVRDYLKRFGATKETVEIIKTSNLRIQEMLESSPGIHAFVKRFKANCSQEFMKSNITNFLASLVINEFSWKSQLIVQKTMMAGMLCDITLEAGDFATIAKYELEGGELEERIRQHPIAAAEILKRKRDIIPMETITIVEQHHERPDGKGFPLGESMVARFNQLSAVFIVSQRFVDLLFRNNFDYNKHHDIIKELQLVYKDGVFEKAMDALISVVDK